MVGNTTRTEGAGIHMNTISNSDSAPISSRTVTPCRHDKCSSRGVTQVTASKNPSHWRIESCKAVGHRVDMP